MAALHRISWGRLQHLRGTGTRPIRLDPVSIAERDGVLERFIPSAKHRIYHGLQVAHPEHGTIEVYWPRDLPQDHGYATVQ